MPDGDLCSFCGQRQPGGVSGQATPTRVYICPDCIRATRAELHGESAAEAPPLPEGT